jgi:hypothetical protein
MGILPTLLFPLLWVSPLIIVVASQVALGEQTFLSRLANGDWRDVVVCPLAALLCGWFWEMWNVCSLAKWEYAIPFVDRFHLFEMPVLGYAGYLPFGLECAVIAGMIPASTARTQ